MSRLYDHHGANCPEDCMRQCDEEELVDVYPDLDLKKLRSIKKGKSMEGPYDCTIYCERS